MPVAAPEMAPVISGITGKGAKYAKACAGPWVSAMLSMPPPPLTGRKRAQAGLAAVPQLFSGKLPAPGGLKEAHIEANITAAVSVAEGDLTGGLWWALDVSPAARAAWQRVNKAPLPKPLVAAPLSSQPGVAKSRRDIIAFVVEAYNSRKMDATFIGKKGKKWGNLPVAPLLKHVRVLNYDVVASDPATVELLCEYNEHTRADDGGEEAAGGGGASPPPMPPPPSTDVSEVAGGLLDVGPRDEEGQAHLNAADIMASLAMGGGTAGGAVEAGPLEEVPEAGEAMDGGRGGGRGGGG